MLVISDTTCITSLLQIHHDFLLHSLFGRIIVPPSVFAELRQFHPSLPAYLELKVPKNRKILDSLLEKLDKGEAEAICLCMELSSPLLIIDEQRGRNVAAEKGINFVGTLGVLLLAKAKGLIAEVTPLIGKLETEAGCYFHEDLVKRVTILAGEYSTNP